MKVTDFGIARAVTSTTITQTGSVVGSVHYFSPEHAKGVATGEKSDLYSLGIVLYQMLTGRLPFLGESPISVALKHLQEEFEEPREVNPLIPQSVENVILKSMRKNPQERYQSAEEMMEDLETCLLPSRINEPKMEFEEDEDSTLVMPAIKSMERSSRPKDEPDAEEDGPDEKAAGRRKRKWVKPTVIIASVLLFLGIMAGVVAYVNKMLEVPEVTVPGVVDMPEEDAIRLLEESGLAVDPEVIREYKPGVDEGIVFGQSRPEGTVVKKDSLIQLSVGAAKPLSVMPDLSGKTYEEALALLKAQNVNEETIKQNTEHNDEVDADKIIRQSPAAGAEFDPDQVEIVLTISRGKQTVNMPSLIGMSRDEAVKTIESLGLEVEAVKEKSSYDVERGKVMEQWPFEANEAVSPGTKITITVSSDCRMTS